MVNVACNFPRSGDSKWCKLCHLCYEQQEHLMHCIVLRKKLKSIVDFSFNYCDMEGPIALQEKFAKAYTVILTTRENILNEVSRNVDQSTGGQGGARTSIMLHTGGQGLFLLFCLFGLENKKYITLFGYFWLEYQ